jgi:ParB family transcriptional regulator, chromosome partitioning protein
LLASNFAEIEAWNLAEGGLGQRSEGVMSKGNRGFGDAVLGGVATSRPAPKLSPADGVLQSRSSSLAQLATGRMVTDRTQWIDPALCRPWSLHNRDLDHLNVESCADLIESIKAEGKQRIPAIVRRLKDDPDYEYEIIAGVRRWWTISWLRTNNYPDFLYLVTIQTVTDEEGFRLADVENRARKDISDLERARDYLRALDLFYNGSQTEMAGRLNVSTSWMSRMLEVGRLPEEVISAFSHPHDITVRHAAQIGPVVNPKEPAVRKRVLKRAAELAEARKAGAQPVAGHMIVAELLNAAKEPTVRKAASKQAAKAVYASDAASGRPLVEVELMPRGKGHMIRLFSKTGAGREEIQKALAEMVEQLF